MEVLTRALREGIREYYRRHLPLTPRARRTHALLLELLERRAADRPELAASPPPA